MTFIEFIEQHKIPYIKNEDGTYTVNWKDFEQLEEMAILQVEGYVSKEKNNDAILKQLSEFYHTGNQTN